MAWVVLVTDLDSGPRAEAFDTKELADAAADTILLTVSPDAWVAVIDQRAGNAEMIQQGELTQWPAQQLHKRRSAVAPQTLRPAGIWPVKR